MSNAYYRAYDLRYRQVHALGLQWAADAPTPIVSRTLERCGITAQDPILELGCGEGRDALPLLRAGYALTATDVSPQAVDYCRAAMPGKAEHFAVLDAVTGESPEKNDPAGREYAFIYAVAVLHMLTGDAERRAFYHFIRTHLKKGYCSLLCTMGDGETELCSDPAVAFDSAPRTHVLTGRRVSVASTTCRMVSFPTLRRELSEAGLTLVDEGLTAAEPDFDSLLWALVRRD